MISKSEFIEKFAEKNYTKMDAKIIVNDFIDTLEELLVGGEDVMFKNFGSFKVVDRAAHGGVSPVDGSPIVKPACKALKFVPSGAMKQKINQNSANA